MSQRLIQAAWDGDVDYLLQEIDINPYTLHAVALEGSETPLHVACFAGHLNFVATVIRLRKEFSKELNQDGFSPLHIAAACGHVKIVKELLEVDFGLCLINGKDRKIPLHLAVVKGKVDIIKELLLSSLDSIECITVQGETSLHLAVKNNQFEAFKVLIQHLKQVNKEDLLNFKDFQGNTIFHLAVSRKQYEVVDFLINGDAINKEKIELNSLNKSGLTPLDMLLIHQSEAGDREINELLIQAGGLKGDNTQSLTYRQVHRSDHHDTPRENSPSPARRLLDYFKNSNIKESPSKQRNTLLVIAILITSATYQPALSPPGGAWQDDYTPQPGNITMLSATNNNNTSSKPHTAGEAIMGTHKPVAYTIFLFANSVGFYTSIYMITVLTAAFPLRLEFHLSMFALATTYATCMGAIAPDKFISYAFMAISIALPYIIPLTTMFYRNYMQRPGNVSPYAIQESV